MKWSESAEGAASREDDWWDFRRKRVENTVVGIMRTKWPVDGERCFFIILSSWEAKGGGLWVGWETIYRGNI